MIIYVDGSRAAHTIDQAHEMAIKIKALIDAGFGERVRQFVKTVSEALRYIADGFIKAWNKIKTIASDILEKLLRPKKENYRSAMQRQQRKNHGFIKMYTKNKFNGVRPSDYARFSRNRRKG